MKVGFTTTIPFEILHAAGVEGVDLNNIFITDPNREKLLEAAERRGLPTTLCSWIKGIYSVLQQRQDIETVIAVVSGDCSNALPLVDLLRSEGREVITFAYPFDRDEMLLKIEMEKLMKRFSVSYKDVEKSLGQLDLIRDKAEQIDLMTWKNRTVTGFENHYYLVNMSDFEGDPMKYSKTLSDFMEKASLREEAMDLMPLAFVGVPPIFSDFYEFLESKNARVVYNETQRQFSFPSRSSNIVRRYLDYTYPYSLLFRMQDIKRQLEIRGIKGVLHYTQSFCHHQMDHVLLRENIGLPVLMLEGDRPAGLDERTRLRVESFLEMLQ